jgi:penicillin-binding protein 1C
MRRIGYIVLGIFGAAVAFFVLGLLLAPMPTEDFRKESVHSLRVLDARGILLREFLNDAEGHGTWRSLKEIAPSALSATIAVEDKHFYSHPGVDPIAIVRAAGENLRALAFHSGGSTITQQVIRNVYHRPRTLVSKIAEAWDALRLEQVMLKEEILEQYLNRVPYGNRLVGIEAASRWYFGKPAKDLSLAEAAFLAGLPNAPSTLNPYRNFSAAMLRQKNVLRRMIEQKLVSQPEYDRAVRQPVSLIPPEASFKAPHAVEMAERQVRALPGVGTVRTTIDYSLQENIQFLVKGHLASLSRKNVTNAAVIVVENRTGNIRALVGSADYFDENHSGQVNGALAQRQPGSSIKPFMYGVALEAGHTAAEVLADIPTAIPDIHGDYVPENYDKKFHGPVRLRTALACSYNVPAVRTLRTIGVDPFLQRLRAAGFESLTQTADYYGFGLTLGNGDVTLVEMTRGYLALANGGILKPLRLLEEVHTAEGTDCSALISATEAPRRIYQENTAFILTDILSDQVARRPAFGISFQFPFPCAMKTGTTKDYRDNWTLGYTTEYTVGVWVGNFGGTSMHGVSGITGAGQIFSNVMMLLHTPPYGSPPKEFPIADGVVQCTVCPRSGRLPNKWCGRVMKEWFVKGTEPRGVCDVHQLYRVHEGTERVFEVFSREFALWMEMQHISLPPADSRRIVSRGSERLAPAPGQSFAFVSPNDGDCFKIDPILRKEYQRIRIVGAVPEKVSRVTIRIDGGERLPFELHGVWWQLKKGAHRIQMEGIEADHRIVSKPITIHVD